MGFIKGALFGVAVYAAVQHITKKDRLTGRSILDEILEKKSALLDKTKNVDSAVGIISDPPVTIIEEYIAYR